ncbi:hypothetical protein SAMN05421805_10121 [Saccharopolyspora antimicrobica]|uniref:Uncharacterized protein n=1 Tax=Saccharopolyspora antimicrobica TaxID=455193 RepID=A0A1I4Q9E1_9PSEU|nr:WXG100 family type VII secretion target [Saccharopolyspora antimicrobica]RKT84831.1 hypothetical protein ATL45_3159 [Saccharopolyspora antimicrobica]SFM36679.1 hypothetical protein SAMN05421805_10121 [Saccharopolyspora antimicrobica]
MAPDPKAEVPGELPAIDETLTTMTKLGTAFENAGQGFQKISTDGWKGATADAFQDYYQQEPPKWFRAADAFTDSAKALQQYRDTLAWAQRQAEQACADIEAAERQSERALAQYEKSDATGPFEDPGAAARQQAQAALDDAKKQVEEAAKKAAAVLLKAADEAPPQPGLLTQLGSALGDIGQNVAEAYGDFWRGSFEGGLEMIQQLRAITPFDPYNMTHPSKYAENMSNLVSSTFAAGKAFITDPVATTKAMASAGIESFTKDPFGSLGKLAPEAAAGLVTGGSSTAGSVTRKVLGELKDGLTPDTRKADDWNWTPDSPASPPSPPPAPRPEPVPQSHQPNTSTPSGGWDHPPTPNHSTPPPPPHQTTGSWTDTNPSHTDYNRTPDHTTSQLSYGHTPESAGHHIPEAPSAEQRVVNEALAEVREHGDGIQKFDDRYGFEPGTKDLPEGLSRDNPDPFGNDAWQRPRDFDAPEFIHRNVDPSDEANALWRAVHSQDLDQIFREGIAPRDPDGRADIAALDGHVGGATNSRFVSATDSLEHALQRGQNRPDDYGVILKFRTGGGIDVDATMHDYLGNSRYGYTSHGEREFALKDGAHPSIIEGAYRPTSFGPDGKPTGYEWVPNPYFDESILRKGAR